VRRQLTRDSPVEADGGVVERVRGEVRRLSRNPAVRGYWRRRRTDGERELVVGGQSVLIGGEHGQVSVVEVRRVPRAFHQQPTAEPDRIACVPHASNGRPNHTWLRATESDIGPLNIGPSS